MSRRDSWLLVCAFAGLGFVLTLVATRHGPGISPDSVSYLAAARTLAHHGTVLDFDGSPLTYWPPGFPAMLAVFEVVGIKASDAARIVNAAMLATAVVLTYVLLRRHVRSSWTVLFGSAVIAVSPTLLRTADMAWSEPTFTVLVLAAVLLLEDAARTRKPLMLAVSGVVVSCAVLVRYHGFALVGAGIVIIVLAALQKDSDRRRAVGQGIVAAVWFTAWALLGPALWALRNVLEDQPALGRRMGAEQGVATIAQGELASIGRLFVPEGVPVRLAELLGVVVLTVIAAGIVVIVRDTRERGMTPVAVTVLALLGVAFLSRIRAGSDINARILSPVYPLLVVLALWLFDYVRSAARGDSMRGALNLVAMLGLAGLLAFGVWSVALAWSHGRHARGFAGPRGTNSELVGATRALPSGAKLYSDDPLTISAVTERQPVGLLLAPGQPNVIGRAHPSSAQLEQASCSRPIWVAWFGVENALPVTVTDVHEYRDGRLGRVEGTCN